MALTLPVSTQSDKIAVLMTAYRMLANCGEFDLDIEDGEDTPRAFKDAQCEQALFIIQNPDWEVRMALIAQGVSSSGTAEESYNRLIAEHVPVTVPIAPMARAILADYASNTASVQTYVPTLDET